MSNETIRETTFDAIASAYAFEVWTGKGWRTFASFDEWQRYFDPEARAGDRVIARGPWPMIVETIAGEVRDGWEVWVTGLNGGSWERVGEARHADGEVELLDRFCEDLIGGEVMSADAKVIARRSPKPHDASESSAGVARERLTLWRRPEWPRGMWSTLRPGMDLEAYEAHEAQVFERAVEASR